MREVYIVRGFMGEGTYSLFQLDWGLVWPVHSTSMTAQDRGGGGGGGGVAE